MDVSLANDKAYVGHSDGMGPGGTTAAPYNSWNSAHENGGCDDTAPKGGAGRFYCFAIDYPALCDKSAFGERFSHFPP